MRKNVASQYIHFQMISKTDGSDVLTGTPVVYYTIAGVQNTGTGTSTHEGNGQWSYQPVQAETNGNQVGFTMTLTGAVSQTVNVFPVAFDPSDAADLGIAALTGNIPQTADHTSAIAGIPTVAEFNARTLLADSYFDPSTDTVANVTTVDTTTDLTNLPSIPANWITAAGITASALDGKGNWNVGKTGYTLTQTFPTNFADLTIEVTTGKVNTKTADTVTDGAKSATALSTTDIDSILTDTTNIKTRIPAALVSGRMDSNMSAIDDSNSSAVNLAASTLGIIKGVCEGTPTQTIIQTDLSNTNNDALIGRVIVFTSGNTADEATLITDYVGSSGTVTVDTLITAPSSGDTFVIV